MHFESQPYPGPVAKPKPVPTAGRQHTILDVPLGLGLPMC